MVRVPGSVGLQVLAGWAASLLLACSAGEPEVLDEHAPTGPAEATIDGGARTTDAATGKSWPEASAIDAAPPGIALAPDVTVDEVAVFQGVKISVAADGRTVTTRNAPVVANRAMLVRVYVSPSPAWRPHTLTGELRLTDGAKDLPVLTDSKVVSAVSTDDAMASTFNFEVPADVVTETLKWSVAVRDPEAPRGLLAKASTAEYPKGGGVEALGAKSTGKGLTIVLVPVRYDADGSKRYPDTSPAQIERYKTTLQAMYPTSKVDVTVHSNVVWDEPVVGGDSKAWARFLAGFTQLRENDQVADDVYYYGLFLPAETKAQHCKEGCITGMCNLVEKAGDASMRACIGVGYTGMESAETMAHELGHAHGRPHSPCGAKDNEPLNPDPDFPSTTRYSRAGIGTWGYDLRTKELVSPSKSKDFMSYCDPAWVSDYNYGKLFMRMQQVNGVTGGTPSTLVASAAATPPSAPARTYRVLVDSDGTLAWGPTLRLRRAPMGDTRRVVFRDRDGAVVGESLAHRYLHAEGDGASYYVDSPPADYETMSLEPGSAREGLRFVHRDTR